MLLQHIFRVLYLAGLLQQYITSATGELKALREASSTQRDREKMQFLVNALKMAENVYKICKDIVHSKPTFSLILTSSWKKSVVRTTDANPEYDLNVIFLDYYLTDPSTQLFN